MISHYALLKVLSNGKYHSGAALGKQFGISRAAVWKIIQKIELTSGLTVFAVKGKGYKLQNPVELLDKDIITTHLNETTLNHLSFLEVFFDIDSTNKYLNNKSIEGATSGFVVLAEQQTKGLGRRGRTWVSPFGGNLYLSILWRTLHAPAQLGCLSLIIAVAIVRVLQKIGIKDAGVKWPNDIYCQNKKLAGILLEMRGESSGPSVIVIGVGINISMPLNNNASIKNNDLIKSIDQPWIDIESILKTKISRNHFSARVINEIFKVLLTFPENQKSLLDEWQQMDVLKAQEIEVHFPDKVIQGKALGITPDGALKVEVNGQVVVCFSGEVSVRHA